MPQVSTCVSGLTSLWEMKKIVLLLVLVTNVLFCSSCSSQNISDASIPIQCSQKSSTPVNISMYYSSEKEAWLNKAITDFNQQHFVACDGPITVEPHAVESGQSMLDILNHKIEPDIWSPAGTVWVTLLNNGWRVSTGKDFADVGSSTEVPLAFSPIVIAMWKPEAEALGWPNRPLGWSDIDALSTSPQGWGAYGHPEWGSFKFGHTHPTYSDAGLASVIAMNYAAVNKVRGLNVNDVNDPQTKDFVANVESSVVQYGESTAALADKMYSSGPEYLSAMATSENLVIQANDKKKYPHLASPIVAIYPKEGTFEEDHPFVIAQTSWVSNAKKQAALVLRSFLLSQSEQQKALAYGFRPAKTSTTLASPLDTAHGVDPHEPQTLLQLPEANVVNAITESWQQQRRKVDVLLVLDSSGSMNDEVNGKSKIDAAKEGIIEFINLLSDSDSLGLTTFSAQADELTPLSPLGPKRQEVLQDVDTISAGGWTRLFDTVLQEVNTLKAYPSTHIKALVVLTDGEDTSSQLTIDQLLPQITPTGKDKGTGIQIFTIAYGNDANATDLTRIAKATNAQEFAGNPDTIKQVYYQISKFL